jgi:hypothetical protein
VLKQRFEALRQQHEAEVESPKIVPGSFAYECSLSIASSARRGRCQTAGRCPC